MFQQRQDQQHRDQQRRQFRTRTTIAALALGMGTALNAAPVPASAADAPARAEPVTTLPGGATGTALGPGEDLYVASPHDGTGYRIDRATHQVTTFHEGLPAQVLPLGGVMDIAFQGSTPYALVTLVGPDVGGDAVVGLYRLDGPTSATLVADLGQWSTEHPPSTEYAVPSGVQYALQPFRGGFLVTDGHHNRVLSVGTDGSIEEFLTLGNVVPTGLDRRGNTILLAEAGPVPHNPETGRVVEVDASSATVTGVVASGGRLLVDVERGRGSSLYALAQGLFPPGGDPGAPALPDTGSLLRANSDGSFTTIATGLDRPTSMEISGLTAWVVGLDGDVVTIPLPQQ